MARLLHSAGHALSILFQRVAGEGRAYPTTHNASAATTAHKENRLCCCNTDATLWNNYGRSASAISPTRAVSVTINKYGVVGNGMRIMAVFPSLRSAVNTLASAGFKITRQLGCGHVKTNFNARFTA